jgi:hypothetical protein
VFDVVCASTVGQREVVTAGKGGKTKGGGESSVAVSGCARVGTTELDSHRLTTLTIPGDRLQIE